MPAAAVLLTHDAREDLCGLRGFVGIDDSFNLTFGPSVRRGAANTSCGSTASPFTTSVHSLKGGSASAFDAGGLFFRLSCLRNRL